jgi:atypical dual specificity phosphatase
MKLIKSRGCLFLIGEPIDNCAKYWLTNSQFNLFNENLCNKQYHITVATADEMIHEINETTYELSFVDLGLGCYKSEVYWVVCSFPQGDIIRQKLNLPPKDFHITLGYKTQDIHTCSKNLSSIIQWNQNIDVSKLYSSPNILIQLLEMGKHFNTHDLIQIAKYNHTNKQLLTIISSLLETNIYGIGLKINLLLRNKETDNVNTYLKSIIDNEYENSSDPAVITKILTLLNKMKLDGREYSYQLVNDKIRFLKSPRNFSRVRDNLYGSAIPNKQYHWDLFANYGITDVITLMETPLDTNLYGDIKIHYYYVDDLKPPTLEQVKEIINIIDNGSKTLVHCFGGVGRTGTVLSAYLMQTENLTRNQALDQLVGRKTIISDSQEVFLKEWYAYCNINSMGQKIKLPPFIMFVGYPASGKSTLANAIVQTYPTVLRVNQDEIRTKGKCEELVGKHVKTQTVLLDRCNLTKSERKYWLNIAFNPKTWCIYFNSDIDDCKYRITRRKNHPTIKEGTGITILDSLDGKLEEPELSEGFNKIISINSLEESNNLMEKWGLIKPEIEPVIDEQFIIKFPRTKHLANLGSATRDDLLMSQEEINQFLNKEIYIEEKIDGANLGFSINSDSKIMVQNRSHYVTSSEQPQFKPLDAWVQAHSDDLWTILEPGRHILYGEWLYMKHSIKYENLPDYFIAFDLYDKITKKFASRCVLEQLLSQTSIQLVPLVAKGTFKKIEEIKQLINTKSKFYEGKIEGVYCRINNTDNLISRGKIVRSDFICGNSSIGTGKLIHWSKGILETNNLKN